MTNKLINYLTYILFFIPFTLLIVDVYALFPFITTKAIIFRILVSLGLVLVVCLYLLTQKTFPYKNLLFIGAVLFFIANSVSTILSVNPYRSFWGNAERMEGLWSLFFYLAYFFLLITLFQFEPKAKKTIFYSILIVTTIISLMEINQAFFLKEERPSATLGNPTYIGFMNLLTIFLIFYFIFEEKVQIKDLKINFYLLLILINLLSLIGSQTRGSILGLLAGIFAAVVFYILFAKFNLKKKILIFSFLILFLIIFYLFLRTEVALMIPGIKRISETLQNPTSIFPRLFAWKIFLTAFLQRPIFGWGPETEPIAFFSNFDPKVFYYEQAIFDRPHNKFIEILVKSGVFGFISWAFLVGAFFYYLIKKRQQNLVQATSLVGFLVAYLVQSFSLFDIQASYLLFFFGLSLVIDKIEIKTFKERFIRPYLILISGLSLILIILHLRHFYIVRKIIEYIRYDDPERASQQLLRISEIAGPFLTEEAIISFNYLNTSLKKIKKFETFLNFNKILEKAIYKDEKDYRLNVVYLNILNAFLEAKKNANLNFDKEVNESKKIFTKLIKIYPKVPEIYLNYAHFLNLIKDEKELTKLLESGENTFKNIYPRYFLEEAKLYFSRKDNELAYKKLKEALNQGFNFQREEDFEVAIEIYLANKDVGNATKTAFLWINRNKSDKIKTRLKEIFEFYKFGEFLKFDK